jgi:hypothetical protein
MINKLKNTRRRPSPDARIVRQSPALRFFTLIIFAVSLSSFGCTTSQPNANATVNSNAGVGANPNPNAVANMNSSPGTGVSSAAFAAKEPEQYSLIMAVSGQGSASNKQGSLAPQNIEFAKMGSDRRWALNLPAIGQVAYLEKAGMKYLLLPSRSQYVEISPEALGFQLGNVMTPSAIVEQLKPRTQYENVGTETINGRAATKYRFVGAADTRTKAGTVQSESYIYMDEVTGLPLRADLNFASSSGGQAHGFIETRDLNLNPDAKLFEVPATFKKVTTEELKQQVQGFIQFMRLLAPAMTQQLGGNSAAPPPAASPANPNPTPERR